MKTISLKHFFAIFDQSSHDIPPPTVIADNRAGYGLTLDLAGEAHEVVGDDGERLRFRTFEHLLDVLVDVPELAKVARLDFSGWHPAPRYR